MKFARYIFLIAGIYGLLVLLPQYFLEEKIGLDSLPPITHPEFFYGFIGVALAFQVVLLLSLRSLRLCGKLSPKRSKACKDLLGKN